MLAFWLVPCYAKVMAAKVHQFQKTPSGFRVADVTIRLARPDERARWDAIMDQRHYLGFKRFAGRGLRYVFEWHGHWLGLAGWQSGAFKCGPRDRWVGWKRGIQFARLHLISNNTRFLILGEPGCFPKAQFPKCMHGLLIAAARQARGDALPTMPMRWNHRR